MLSPQRRPRSRVPHSLYLGSRDCDRPTQLAILFKEIDLSNCSSTHLQEFTYAFSPSFFRSYIQSIRIALHIGQFKSPGTCASVTARQLALCAIIAPPKLVVTVSIMPVLPQDEYGWDSEPHLEHTTRTVGSMVKHVSELFAVQQPAAAELRIEFMHFWDKPANRITVQNAAPLLSAIPASSLSCLDVRMYDFRGLQLHQILQKALNASQQKYNIAVPPVGEYGHWRASPSTVPRRSELHSYSPDSMIHNSGRDILPSVTFAPHTNWSTAFRITLTHLEVCSSDIVLPQRHAHSMELTSLLSLRLHPSPIESISAFLQIIMMPSLRRIDLHISEPSSATS